MDVVVLDYMWFVFGAMYVLLLARSVSEVRTARRNIPDRRDWNTVEENIKDLHRGIVDALGVKSLMIKRILKKVLTDEPGVGMLDRVELAMQPLELSVDRYTLTLKEWAGNFVIFTLFCTATTLAIFLEFYKTHGSTGYIMMDNIPNHFGLVFTFNAISLFTALVYHLWYLAAKSSNNDALMPAYDVLGQLRSPATGEVDPKLAAALDYIARKLDERSEAMERRSMERVGELTAEIRLLSGAIKDMFKEAIAGNDRDDVSAEGWITLSRAVQTSIEEMTRRFDEIATKAIKPATQGLQFLESMRESVERLMTRMDDLKPDEISERLAELEKALTDEGEKLRASANEGMNRVQSEAEGIRKDMERIIEGTSRSREMMDNMRAELDRLARVMERDDVQAGIEGYAVAITEKLDGIEIVLRELVKQSTSEKGTDGAWVGTLQSSLQGIEGALGHSVRVLEQINVQLSSKNQQLYTYDGGKEPARKGSRSFFRKMFRRI